MLISSASTLTIYFFKKLVVVVDLVDIWITVFYLFLFYSKKIT